MATRIFMYEKTIKTKEGKSWAKKLATLATGATVEVVMSKDAEKKLIQTGIDAPWGIELDESDYFIKGKKATTKEGKPYTRYSLCITDFRNVEQEHFQSLSIDQVVEELLGYKDGSN